MPPARKRASSSATPAPGGITLDRVLRSLADPVRLSIVRQLLACAEGEKTCGGFEHEVAKPTFSHHLAILEEAGIIQARPEGTRRLISLRLEALERRFPGLLDLIRAVPR